MQPKKWPGGMQTTTMLDNNKTQSVMDRGPALPSDSLVDRYKALLTTKRIQWTTYHRLERQLGSGGQGVVYLSARQGADGFNQPVAMKVFSPERFASSLAYKTAMERVARVASRVASIQHDNLLDVQDFVDRNRIRVMVMEWIDGYDVRQLMSTERLKLVRRINIHQAVGLHRPRDRYLWSGASAIQGRCGRGRRPRMSGCPGCPTSRGDRAW